MFLGFLRVGGTFGFSFISSGKRYTPFIQFSLVDKWWIPHFEIWRNDAYDTFICGWLFLYFGYMKAN